MVGVLGLILAFVWIVCVLFSIKLKSFYPVIFAILFTFLYNHFQPSYMPKGKVVLRDKIPELVVDDNLEIRDLSLKPEHSYEKVEDEMTKGLPWKREYP